MNFGTKTSQTRNALANPSEQAGSTSSFLSPLRLQFSRTPSCQTSAAGCFLGESGCGEEGEV